MFGRRTRTLLPNFKELLEGKLVRDVRERKLQRKEVQTRYFNRIVKELPSLTEGNVVRMKPKALNGKQRWAKAQVQQQVNVRSYAVRTEDGRLFRRNCRHLRQSKELFVAKDADVEILSPVTNCPPTEVYTEPSVPPAQNSTGYQHLCAVSKQAKDYQLSGQLHHQLSIRRTVQLLVADTPFVLLAT